MFWLVKKDVHQIHQKDQVQMGRFLMEEEQELFQEQEEARHRFELEATQTTTE